MKRFACSQCGSEVYFDNTVCIVCAADIGFRPSDMTMVALNDTVAHPCANAGNAVCNWLVEEAGEVFCRACRHNRTVPDSRFEETRARWAAIELAKRQLFYSLLRWRLPTPVAEGARLPLRFDFLADGYDQNGKRKPVLTGHANGIITLNLAEGDDAERESRRSDLGESYRTIIGHMRHEIGHYYWEVLVKDSARIGDFRALFGDERADYGAALKRHYDTGPPTDWAERHVSPYAAAHPWEDFAETWAHWIHMSDGLETARAFGVGGSGDVPFDPYEPAGARAMIDAWVPLTLAVNALNRSLGQPDLYPFVLSDPIGQKFQFMHDLIAGFRS